MCTTGARYLSGSANSGRTTKVLQHFQNDAVLEKMKIPVSFSSFPVSLSSFPNSLSLSRAPLSPSRYRRVLADRCRFFVKKLLLRSTVAAVEVEICDCDDVEGFVETVVLMYCDDLKRRLVGEEVSKVLGLLKGIAAHLLDVDFSGGKSLPHALPLWEKPSRQVS